MRIVAHYVYEGASPPKPGVHVCIYVGRSGTLSFGIGRWEPDIGTGVFGWVPDGGDLYNPVPLVVLEVEGDPEEVIKQLQAVGSITLKHVKE